MGAAALGKGGLGCSKPELEGGFASGVAGTGVVGSGPLGVGAGSPSVFGAGDAADRSLDEAFVLPDEADFVVEVPFGVVFDFELPFGLGLGVLLFFLLLDEDDPEDFAELFFFGSALHPGSSTPPNTKAAQKMAMTAFLTEGGSDGLTS